MCAATAASCVTTTKALLALQRIDEGEDLRRGPGSRLPVGSSISTQPGRFTRARAMATRWRSPPDSWPGRCPARAAGRRREHRRSTLQGLAAPWPAMSSGHGDVLEGRELAEQMMELVDEIRGGGCASAHARLARHGRQGATGQFDLAGA
jgi:hypothetical protein